jgi:virginiamycin B lyase
VKRSMVSWRMKAGVALSALALAVSAATVGGIMTAGPAGAAIDRFTDPSISQSVAITTGPDGALWFTNQANSSIGRITTNGTVSNFTDGTIAVPQGIAVGPDGALWFANGGNDSIGRIATDGTVSAYNDPTISGPGSITAGPDGALWFIDAGSHSIGRITTGGAVSNFTDPSISGPQGIVAGSDGALWFTNVGSDSIGRITTGGVVSNYTDPSLAPTGNIAAGPDGAIWFTNFTGGASSIGRITTSGTVTSYTDPSVSDPDGIVAGPDGALWFTNNTGDSIGRITTAGTISNYTDASVNEPEGITAGPDGALWFLNRGDDSIGRLSAASVPANNAPVATHVAAPNDAAWSVPIANTAGVVVAGVTATLHATANGSNPLGFDTALMPGCAAGAGNSEICTLADIPAHATGNLNVYVPTTGLSAGASITGDVTISANGQPNSSGTLGPVTVSTTVTAASCGVGCVTVKPGQPVASNSGPPTDAHPTKQIIALPNRPGAQPVNVTLQSINPSSKLSAADRLLCPATGNTCSGQISVVAGDFSKYTDKRFPIRVQIVAKWKTRVGAGKLLMLKDTGGPPVQLAKCVVKGGEYNTPCLKSEVVSGTAAKHNLVTTTTILFVGTDPRFARHVANGPDAPVSVNATAGAGKAIVQWKPPVVTNGKLTGYTITPHLGKTALESVNVAGTARKTTINGLAKGKSYTFTIIAKTAHGVSLASKASNAVNVR